MMFGVRHISLLLLVCSAVSSSAFLGLFGYNEEMWNACAEGHKIQCSCPLGLLEGMKDGLDCSLRNIQQINNGMVISENYKIVDFSDNNISAIVQATFAVNNSHVTQLDLSANRLTKLEPKSFANLPSLVILDISNNLIENITSEALGGLSELQEIDLSYNRISALPEKLFTFNVNLTKISLEYNKLTTLPSTLFNGLSSLRMLDLTYLRLRTLHEESFQGLKIEELLLVHNDFKQIPTKALYQLRGTLKKLDLSGNNFEVIPASSIYNLPHLEVLIMEQMVSLKSIEAYAFTELPKLKTVVLRYLPKIQFIDELTFASTSNGSNLLSPVQDFTLSYTILTNIPEQLLRWDQVKYLNLYNNHWKCDCNFAWIRGSEMEKLVGKEMYCSSPARVRGSLVSWLKKEDFVCRRRDSPPSKWEWGTMLIVSIIGVIVSVSTVSILFYRRHGYLCRKPTNYSMLSAQSRESFTVVDATDVRATVSALEHDAEIDTEKQTVETDY